MYSKKYNILMILIFLATITMSVGYAAINNISLNILGTVNMTLQDNLFISELTYESGNNVNQNDSEIKSTYETSFNSKIVLSDTDNTSSITYRVVIHNNSEDTYEYDTVTHLEENVTYDNENIVYNVTTNDYVLEPNSSTTLMITFSYKDNILAPSNILNSYISFKFKKQLSITYENITNNNYPTTIKDGDTLQVNFTPPIPTTITVKEDNVQINDFTYENNVLIIPNVTGNLIISSINFEELDYVFTEENSTIVNPDTSTTINIADFITSSQEGINNSPKTITNINVVLNYTVNSGSTQSIDMVLTTSNNSYSETITFRKANSGQDITISFDNLNISTNEIFTISYSNPNLNNQKVEIVQKSISIVFQE